MKEFCQRLKRSAILPSLRGVALLVLIVAAAASGTSIAQVAPPPSPSPPSTSPKTPEQEFFDRLFATCNRLSPPLTGQLADLCDKAFGGVLAGGGFVAGAVSLNSGMAGSQGGSAPGAALQKKVDEEKKKGNGASADFKLGNLGVLFALQGGKTDRSDTVREPGFNSDLKGGVFGLDYRFSDIWLAGMTLGYTETDSTLKNLGGAFGSKGGSGTIYTSYIPMPNASLGAYLGYSRLDQDGTRRVLFGGASGITGYETNSDMWMFGLSSGYDWTFDSSTVGVFLNLDGNSTKLKGYVETGTTGLEMIFPQQKISSLTSSLGARASTRVNFEWGTLVPEARLGWVHEFRNDSRAITSALVLDPTATLTVLTDNPDRDYFIGGLGATAEISRRTRLFVNYEKLGGHSFLSTWTVNAGVHIGF